MPAAVELCTGSSRLVKPKRPPRNKKVDCSSCMLTLPYVSTVVSLDEVFYELPPHRRQGYRDPEPVTDWSDPE